MILPWHEAWPRLRGIAAARARAQDMDTCCSPPPFLFLPLAGPWPYPGLHWTLPWQQARARPAEISGNPAHKRPPAHRRCAQERLGSVVPVRPAARAAQPQQGMLLRACTCMRSHPFWWRCQRFPGQHGAAGGGGMFTRCSAQLRRNLRLWTASGLPLRHWLSCCRCIPVS